MSKKGKPYTLDSGELCVTISNDILKRNQSRWKEFIIGQFHGNLPSKGALHGILNGIWSKEKRDITVSKQGPKTVLIRVPCAMTRRRVLNQRVWHIDGQMMFVADWEPGLSPIIPEMTEVPVWLDFIGVPALFFAKEALEQIASLVGEPVFLHPSTANLVNLEVARVFTIVDITKPLPEAVFVKDKAEKSFRIEVSSPWLPPTCEHCKEIGHSIKRCPTAPILCVPCNSTTHTQEECTRKNKPATTRSRKQRETIQRKELSKMVVTEVSKITKSVGTQPPVNTSPPFNKENIAENDISRGKILSQPDNTLASSSKRKGKDKVQHTSDTDTPSSMTCGKEDKNNSSSNKEDTELEQSDSASEQDEYADSTRLIELVSKKNRRYNRAPLRKGTRTNR